MMDAFVKRCEHCNEPLPENKRGRPQRFCSDQMPASAPENSATAGKWPEIPDQAE